MNERIRSTFHHLAYEETFRARENPMSAITGPGKIERCIISDTGCLRIYGSDASNPILSRRI
jgi:hypothetical protein